MAHENKILKRASMNLTKNPADESSNLLIVSNWKGKE